MRVVLTHDHSHSQTSEPKTIAGYITKLPWDCVIRLRSEQRDLSSADRESTNRQTAQNTKTYRHSWPMPKLSWSVLHRPLNILRPNISWSSSHRLLKTLDWDSITADRLFANMSDLKIIQFGIINLIYRFRKCLVIFNYKLITY